MFLVWMNLFSLPFWFFQVFTVKKNQTSNWFCVWLQMFKDSQLIEWWFQYLVSILEISFSISVQSSKKHPMKLQGFVVCGHSVSMGVGTMRSKLPLMPQPPSMVKTLWKVKATFPANNTLVGGLNSFQRWSILRLFVEYFSSFQYWVKRPQHHIKKQQSQGGNLVDSEGSILQILWIVHPGRLTWNLRIHPSEEENHLPNHHFQVHMLIFGGVPTPSNPKSLSLWLVLLLL